MKFFSKSSHEPTMNGGNDNRGWCRRIFWQLGVRSHNSSIHNFVTTSTSFFPSPFINQMSHSCKLAPGGLSDDGDLGLIGGVDVKEEEKEKQVELQVDRAEVLVRFYVRNNWDTEKEKVKWDGIIKLEFDHVPNVTEIMSHPSIKKITSMKLIQRIDFIHI